MKFDTAKLYEEMSLSERAMLAFKSDDLETEKKITRTVPMLNYTMYAADYVDRLEYLEDAADFWVANYWRCTSMVNLYRWMNSDGLLACSLNGVEPDSDEKVLLACFEWNQRTLAMHKVLERIQDHIDIDTVYRLAHVSVETVSDTKLSRAGWLHVDELEEKLLRILRVKT